MRQFVIGLLATLYLAVSAGVALNFHYCGGKLKAVSWAEPEVCASCGGCHSHSDCCATETEYMRLSIDQEPTAQLSLSQTFVAPLIAVLPTDLLNLYKIVPGEIPGTCSHMTLAPPGRGTDEPLFVRFRMLLI